MKKNLLLAILVLLSLTYADAQTSQIRGRVFDDSTTQGLSNVSVVAPDLKRGVSTDKDGNFTLNIAGRTSVNLVISFVGYTTRTVKATVGTPVSIQLRRSQASVGDEVVVIGYQSVRRKDLTASVSSVSAKDLKDIPINSAAEALNGRLAGVTATTAEGSPDATVNVRVRGGMSITGNNSPLYIIDGVQVENGLSTISPQDIQTIDVLKDAAATAVYGARGGNGVIVITTKSGRVGRMVVSYNGYVGVKNLPKTLKVLSPYDYVVYQSERSRGSSTDSIAFTKNFGTTWDTLNNYKNVTPENWQQDVLGRTGFTQTHNVSASGGTKKFTYNFGYTYNGDKAIVINSEYMRHLLNFKGDYRITDKIRAGVSTRYTYQQVYGAGVSSDQGSAYNRLRNAVKYRPFLSPGQDINALDPISDPNVGNGLFLVNPILLANSEYRQTTTSAYNVTANVSYQITPALSFRSTFGYDYKNFINRQYSDSVTPLSIIQGGQKPISELDTTLTKIITNSNVLTYSIKGFRNKHDFDFLVGEETYDLRTNASSQLIKNYPNGTSHGTAFAQTTLGVPVTGYPRETDARYTSLSFFGTIKYSLLNRYLFSFVARADGASKFAPGKQWGYFPAGSFGWRINNEKFMQSVKFISDLKLRAGFGTVGNNRIGDYLFLSTFSNNGSYYYGINNQAVNGYYQTALPNQNLQWEATLNRNLGLDVGMFKNRLSLSVDYYNNSSKDLLLYVPIASTYGYSTQYQNVGKTNNTGVELQLSGVILRKNNGLNWSANFNISSNKNKVVALGQNQPYFFPPASWGVSGQPTDYIVRIGDPVGSMWGLVSDGFYTTKDFDYNTSTGVYTLKSGVVNNTSIIGVVQPGSPKYKDLNGDGKVDIDHDRQIIGNPNPKFTGGLNQQFSYKNWDLSLFVNFSIGNDVYNANKIEFTNGYTNNANMLAIMQNRWKVVTPTGQTAEWVNGSTVYGIPPDQLEALNANATIWKPLTGSGAFYPSSWAIEDGSFLRINNLTVGYSIPALKVGSIKISRLRFYLTGNNLAVITKYTGYDPEVSVRSSPLTPGLDYSAYPKSRSFIFGVNVSF